MMGMPTQFNELFDAIIAVPIGFDQLIYVEKGMSLRNGRFYVVKFV